MKLFSKEKLVKVAPCCKMHNNGKTVLTAKEIEGLTPQEIFDHEKFEQLRTDCLTNKRNECCKICWDQEDRGLNSYRMTSSWNFNKDLGDFRKELIEFDVSFSNKCNLICRMCNFGGSHQFYKDVNYFKKHNMLSIMTEATGGALSDGRDAIKTEDNMQLNWLLENFKQIRMLKVSGGEPLYDKKVLKLLNLIIKNNHAKNVRLQFHTNATLLDKNAIEMLNNFKEQAHVFSVDGTENIYNYIRHNSSFDLIEENIANWIYKSKNIRSVGFNLVLSCLNVLNLREYFEWITNSFLYKYNIKIHVSEIRPFTRGTSLYNMPIKLLEKSKNDLLMFQNPNEKMIKYDMKNIIRLIDLGIEKNTFEINKNLLKQEIELFDKSRSQSYKNYLNPLLINELDVI